MVGRGSTPPQHHNTTTTPHHSPPLRQDSSEAQYGRVAAEAGLLHLLINTDKQSWRERPLPAHQPRATTLAQQAGGIYQLKYKNLLTQHNS